MEKVVQVGNHWKVVAKDAPQGVKSVLFDDRDMALLAYQEAKDTFKGALNKFDEMMKDVQKGDKVIITPKAYPLQVWKGTVLQKTKNGYSVEYTVNGMKMKSVFHANELKVEV